MLNFYTDAALTRPVTLATPKLFCVPQEGGTRMSRLYIGDNYTANVTAPIASGDAVIYLDQTREFLDAGGTAVINGTSFTYTGKTDTSLTGVSGISSAFAAETQVKPSLEYIASGNLLVAILGGDAIGSQSEIAISLKRSDQSDYGFRGTPAIYVQTSLLSNSSLAVDVQVSVPSGSDENFTDLSLSISGFVVRAAGDHSEIGSSEQILSAICKMVVDRHNQGIVLHERLLPLNRKINSSLPGFVVNQYRWRDNSTINAQELISTNWNVDISSLLPNDFVYGVAGSEDLKPLQIEEFQNSLYMRIQDGFYFNGKERAYLPSAAMMEIVPSGDGYLSHNLLQHPDSQKTIYVGTWISNQSGSFLKDTEYRYCGKSFDTTKADLQFTVNRAQKLLQLNQPMSGKQILLGVVSGDDIDYFDLSEYPVFNVSQVYIDRGPNLSKLAASAFTFDREDGTLIVPAIPGGIEGQSIFATCDPGVGILYSQSGDWKAATEVPNDLCIVENGLIYRASTTGPTGITGLIEPLFPSKIDATVQDGEVLWTCEGGKGTLRADADLNPAFAGISQGFLYLNQNYQGGYQIQLSCDKPRIAIPPAQANIPGLIAFGPVYYDGDYALLIATVLDSNKNPVSNVQLEVVAGSNFEGTVNYQDPTANTIIVRTGGDGVANLIYTPKQDFGYYIPTASLSTTTKTGDTIQLPLDIPLTQLWNSQEGWLITLYQVKDDNPYYGIADANTAAGQIQFITSGTPGTTSYRTNGRRVAILGSDGKSLAPIDALDSLGNRTTDPGFNGNVSKLVFADTIPVDAAVAAYFISYIERVTLWVKEVNSNVKSNSILLQMAPPPLVADVIPYLILDDTTDGKLDVQRLGYVGANLYFPGTALV